MAGFGESFSSSFKNAAQIRASKEQDYFRVAYQEYSDKKSQYEQEEKNWNSNLKKGEAIATKYGAGPDAALKAAEWLQAGQSDAWVDDMVANAKFAVTQKVPQASDVNNVDGQMTASGLVPGVGAVDQASEANNPVMGEVPGVQDEDVLGNNAGPNGIFGESPLQNEDLLAGVKQVFPNAGESDASQANRQVREAGGISQDAFDKTMGGFQPPDTSNINVESTRPNTANDPLAEFNMSVTDGGPNKAKFAAADVAAKQWAKSPNPEDRVKAERWEAVRPDIELALREDIDPQTKADLLKPLGESYKAREEFAKARGASIIMGQEAMELASAVEESEKTGVNPLTQTAKGVSMWEYVKTEGAAALDLLGQLAGQGTDENNVIQALSQELQKDVDTGKITEDAAREYREFNARLTRFVYATGKAYGQSGQSFSNRDFALLKEAVQNSNNSDAFISNLKSIVKTQVSQVDQSLQELMLSPEISLLVNDEYVGPALQKQLIPFEERAKDTGIMDWMNSETAVQKTGDKKQPAPNEPTQERPVGAIIYKGQAVYRKVKQGPDADINNWVQVDNVGINGQ